MDACAQMCKCFLILFNTLFALLGLGFVGLGLWLRFGVETQGLFDIDLNTTQFTIGVSVLVVTGVLMLVVAVVGDCAACNGSKSALGVFIGLVSCLVIVEIAAGVLAFTQSRHVAEEFAKFYISVYTQYLNTRADGQALTLKMFHNAFDCCGIGGPIEILVRDTCPKGSFIQQITFSSCPNAINGMFESKAPLLLGGFLGTAGVMLVALVCSIILRRENPAPHASPPAYVLLTSPNHQMYASPALPQHV
ncbi:CD9 antigen [Triplophysa tibetana]|uniref:Tetraspanin n=1 Tax=Triplophysa tibetana TaxID=1572043 RepID=A0A5A9NC52_9TELE|nr:CD9 antigen [Triplophysa tibetana]